MINFKYAIPEIELFAYTPNIDRVCAAAARSTQKKISSAEIYDKDDSNKVDRTLEYTIKMGHHSITEHGTLTFSIKDVSRSMTHQFVRHRIASYSQQSQRYVKYDEPEFLLPQSIENNPEAKRIYDKFMKEVANTYNELINLVKTEDARYVLPNATATTITATFNPRSLLNFFRLRADKKHAQSEICSCAYSMWAEAALVAPKIMSPKLFQEANLGTKNGEYYIDELIEIIDKSRKKFENAKIGEIVEIDLSALEDKDDIIRVKARVRKLF
ncbi:MAG: FAD-dependent thymidylate synthase [Candidatus Aenigmarchaeota archaeon]|nr:FAD-dependent thymidylate synthase [Candidatus Aenigmarchaeota archaeon]